MMRNFGYKKDGSHWSIWDSKTVTIVCDDILLAEFYPFPTIKFSYGEDTFETDEHEFNIIFVWLFWEIKITKYWGESYRPMS